MSDLIDREEAIKAVYDKDIGMLTLWDIGRNAGIDYAIKQLEKLPSAQTEQRYTEEELKVFRHGISLSLLSKRSSQHWSHDEDTATEIEFLERLYEKVSADIRGETV